MLVFGAGGPGGKLISCSAIEGVRRHWVAGWQTGTEKWVAGVLMTHGCFPVKIRETPVHHTPKSYGLASVADKMKETWTSSFSCAMLFFLGM